MLGKPLRHPLAWWQFYAACFRYAASGILGVIGDAGTILGIATLVFKMAQPALYSRAATYLAVHGFSDDALIKIPLWVGGAILVLRLVTAPFAIYKDAQAQIPATLPNIETRPKIVLEFHPRSVRGIDLLPQRSLGEPPRFAGTYDIAEGFVFRNVGDASAFNVAAVIDVGKSGYRIDLGPTLQVIDRPTNADFALYIDNQRVPPEVGITSFIRHGAASAEQTETSLEFDVSYVGFERTVRFSTPHTLIIPPEGEILIRLSDRVEPSPVPLSGAAGGSAARA